MSKAHVQYDCPREQSDLHAIAGTSMLQCIRCGLIVSREDVGTPLNTPPPTEIVVEVREPLAEEEVAEPAKSAEKGES
jgi:hypothetical protein